MEKSYSASYAAAGVDITAGYRSVELMKQYVARTMTENCIGGLGGFGGLFELDCTGMEHPVLISGTDGVGTKLRIAMLLDKHDTIGIDCVAMCVNDVICAGAKPLVFLDYIACGKNIPEKIAEIVKPYPGCRLHVDATQAVGKTDLWLDGVDTMSFTAHKFYGPNGIGALYKRRGLVIEPQISGGASTTIYRSGTPTLGLAVSLDAALTKALDEQDARTAHVQKLHDRLLAELQKYSLVRINSPAQAVLHILNVSVTGVKGTRFQQALSEQGVCVSVKSACSSDGMPSKAVFAVSRDRRNALSSWRISLSHLTTEEEIDGFLQAFDTCYKSLTNKEN